MKLEHLVTINGAVLVVYYVGDLYYQYEILFWDGSIYQPQSAYPSTDKAMPSSIFDAPKFSEFGRSRASCFAIAVGVESIKTTIGY